MRLEDKNLEKEFMSWLNSKTTKELVNSLKAIKRIRILQQDECDCIECRKNKEAYEVVLSLIKKQDEKINRLLDFIVENTDCPYENNGIDLECEKRCKNGIEKECWKKYFEKEE